MGGYVAQAHMMSVVEVCVLAELMWVLALGGGGGGGQDVAG